MTRLLALAAKVPALVWALLAVLTVGGLAVTAIYHSGKSAGAHDAKVAVVQQQTHEAAAQTDTATAHSNTVVKVARKARQVSDSTRAERESARTAALQELCGDQRLPRIADLIAKDDTIIRRDSETIAVQAGAIDTLLAERAAREHLDSLRVETIAVGQPEPDHHTTAKIAGGVLVGVVGVLTLIHFAR